MDRIEYLAQVSVGRACGFALLAILTAMTGLAFDLQFCLRAGAVLTAAMGLFLAWRAYTAPRRDHRRTEVWLMLDKGRDLPSQYPVSVIGEVLRQTYIRFAEFTGVLTLALLALFGLAWAFDL